MNGNQTEINNYRKATIKTEIRKQLKNADLSREQIVFWLQLFFIRQMLLSQRTPPEQLILPEMLLLHTPLT